MAQARFSRPFSPGARTVSPESIAYWTSRIRCARQTWCPSRAQPIWAIAVGDPMMGAVIAQEGRHHRLGAAFGGDKDGAVGMVEHPEPPVRPPDPHPSLVRSQDRAGEKPRLDQARLGRKRRPAGVEDI